MKIEIKEKVVTLSDERAFTRYSLYIDDMFICVRDKYNKTAFTYLRGMLSNNEKGDEENGTND